MGHYVLPRFTALSGVLAAFMTFWVILIAGFSQPGFSHGQSFVSELNASGNSFANLIGYLGFLPVGVVTLFFIGHLKRELESSKRVATALIFVSFSSLDWFVTAFFPCDAGCPVTGGISISQTIHNLSGLFSTILVPVGIFLLISPLKKMKFHPLVIVCSMASIIAYLVSLVLIVGHVFEGFQGGIQRISLLFFYGYLSALSINIYLKNNLSANLSS